MQAHEFDWESLIRNKIAIGSQFVFEGLIDWFPIFDVEKFMHTLAEEDSVQFHILYVKSMQSSGYRLKYTGRGDFYIVL